MERYGGRIDNFFAKKGLDIYGDRPVSSRVYMGNSNG